MRILVFLAVVGLCWCQWPTPAEKAVLACLTQYPMTMLKYGDPGYDDAKYSYNRRIEGLPMLIVYPATVQQVQQAVLCHTNVIRSGNFTERVNFTIRSGGHSYEAYSTNQHGVVLDMKSFTNVTFSADRVVVQPAIRLGNLYQKLSDHSNWTAVGGTCPMVGFGGFVMGGGFGHISRRFGMGSDRISAVDVVLWDGTLVHANSSVNSDLYWAHRGGGGGNFGVATAFEVLPVINLGLVTSYYVSFQISTTDWDYVANLFFLLQSWGPTRSQMYGSVVFQLQPWNNALGLFGFYLSPAEATLRSDLQAMLNTPDIAKLNQGRKVSISTKVNDYNTLMQQELPRDDRQWFKALNNYIPENMPLPLSSLQTLFKGAMQNTKYKPQLVQFHAYGAAAQTNAVRFDATAFPHRSMDWHLQIYAITGTDPGYMSYMSSLSVLIRPLLQDVSYVDYVDSWLGSDYEQAYYNSNTNNLRTIKKKYDPLRVFDFPQAIRS